MDTLSYKTISVNKETAKKEWVVPSVIFAIVVLAMDLTFENLMAVIYKAPIPETEINNRKISRSCFSANTSPPYLLFSGAQGFP